MTSSRWVNVTVWNKLYKTYTLHMFPLEKWTWFAREWRIKARDIKESRDFKLIERNKCWCQSISTIGINHKRCNGMERMFREHPTNVVIPAPSFTTNGFIVIFSRGTQHNYKYRVLWLLAAVWLMDYWDRQHRIINWSELAMESRNERENHLFVRFVCRKEQWKRFVIRFPMRLGVLFLQLERAFDTAADSFIIIHACPAQFNRVSLS